MRGLELKMEAPNCISSHINNRSYCFRGPKKMKEYGKLPPNEWLIKSIELYNENFLISERKKRINLAPNELCSIAEHKSTFADYLVD